MPNPASRAAASTPSRAPRFLRVALALLAVASLLAACGGAPTSSGVVSLVDPSASPGPSAGPSASVDPEDAVAAFEACMKEHGVEVHMAVGGGQGGTTGSVEVHGEPGAAPGRAQPGGSFDPEAMDKADAVCRHLLPAGGLGDPNATMDPAMADKLLAFSQCMRDHGIDDYPDPQIDGGRVTMMIGGPGSDIDPTSAAFKAAQEACGSELPGGGPGSVSVGVGTEAKP